MLKDLIERRYKILVCIFFVVYLFVGISIFKDYGMSWDEPATRTNGIKALKHVLGGDESLFNYKYRYYGTAFEGPLVFIEIILRLTKNSRSVYLMRHLATFLLFYAGAFFFYLLCRHRFGSWKMGLLGSLFLILSPRIFAHSFYNSKDISCMAMFIISIYTLLKFLDKKTFLRALFHALACAILIDIRIVGVLVPFLTLVFLVFGGLFEEDHTKIKSVIRNALVYILFLILFTILFWPLLWKTPLYHFKEAFQQMSHYPWNETVLYLGKQVEAYSIPWHYVPVWIAVSTPLLYTGLFLTGSFILVKTFVKDPVQFFLKRRDDLVFILWFFFPIAIVILFNAVLYDAWRQMFFIYPAFLMIALSGVVFLSEFIKIKFQGEKQKIMNIAFVCIMILSLSGVSHFMVKWHPYQNVYFNKLAGRDMKEIKKKFELDYWGLSYREALEYILKNDKDKIIKVCVSNYPGKVNSKILTPSDRKRLEYVEKPKDAKYFLGDYRWYAEGYPFENEFYSIKVGGAKIMVVYKL